MTFTAEPEPLPRITSPVADKVVGVEIVEEAVEAARKMRRSMVWQTVNLLQETY